MGTLQGIAVFVLGYIIIDKIDIIISRLNQYKFIKDIILNVFISPHAKNKEQKFALYLLLISLVILVFFL